MRCSSEQAFETYIRRIGEWWDARYSANPETLMLDGAGCTLRFAHGEWNEANVAVREKFGDWSVMLDRFAALADSET